MKLKEKKEALINLKFFKINFKINNLMHFQLLVK